MQSNHAGKAFVNLLAVFSITFRSTPDEVIDLMKSERLIFRFFPFNVRAISSVSSGMTRTVERRS